MAATSNPLLLLLITLLACAGGAGPIVAQVAAETSLVVWRPGTPLQGSLVSLQVRPGQGDSAVAVVGELAGEALHFERDSGVFRALGGVPIVAQDSLALRLEIVRASGARDTLASSLPVAPREAHREELHTAPEFVQPPESLTAQLEAEQELIQEIKRHAHDTPRLWRGRFERPRTGTVTSGFGEVRLFNGVVESRHLGVDFAGQRGAPVRATNRGVVVYAGNLYYSGTTVYLDHGAGLVTGYLHLSRVQVAAGDTVSRGQVIGRVGASGRVTGPHLHWLASYGTISVDPLDLLNIEWPVSRGP
jgi:murein DD-endopeptidase MepM/ murein hydrolase activator NlpD